MPRRESCATRGSRQGSSPMAVADLRRELSRRMYVRSRVARAAAVRFAYVAYSRALLRWDDPSSPEAAASLRRRGGGGAAPDPPAGGPVRARTQRVGGRAPPASGRRLRDRTPPEDARGGVARGEAVRDRPLTALHRA